MAQTSGLTVRQHERQSIELDVEFVVAHEHGRQVRFSPTSSAEGQWIIRGLAIDISPGGMGLVLRHFLPRMCEGEVRVLGPTAVGKGADGTPIHDVIFEHRVKVRRVYMSSHDPTYAAGVSFIDPEPGLEQRVQEVLLMHGRSQPAGGERPRS